jgi:hypothetical protein
VIRTTHASPHTTATSPARTAPSSPILRILKPSSRPARPDKWAFDRTMEAFYKTIKHAV